MSREDYQDSLSDLTNQVDEDEINWVDQEDSEADRTDPVFSRTKASKQTTVTTNTVVMVETAFLASTASLVWLINFYFSKFSFPFPLP
jgi:hypothetical protein